MTRTASAVRLLAGAAGAALVGAGAALPVERVAGGGVGLEGWWLAQTGLAVLVAAAASGRATRRAAFLAALFLLATAAQLAVTSPLWLQFLDLRPRRLANGVGPAAAAALAAQAVVVVAGVRGRLGRLASAVRPLLTPGRVAVAAVLFLLTAAHASPMFRAHGAMRPAEYVALLAAAAVLAALNVANAWLFVEALPADAAARWRARAGAALTLPGEDRPPTRADRWLPFALAAFAFAVATSVAVAVFERVPHIPDEVGYLFHARCLADGRLWAPAPPVPEAFTDYLLDVQGGRWFDTMVPGWPAVLALGVRASATWLVNPLLGAACVLLAHVVVRRWSDRGTAHVAAALLATSPWFLFLSASLMTHVLTLALLLGAWALLFPRGRAPRPAAAGLAGLMLGYLVLVRPLDGVVAGTVTAWWLVANLRPRWASAACYAAGCAAGAIWMLPYNAALTGHALREPLNAYMDRLWYPGVNRLGFGADVGNVPGGWGGLDPLPGHGPFDVLLNANQNLYNVNFELSGWMVGSLVLVLVHLLWGRWTATDRRLGAFALALVAALSLYWFSGGPDFGARYWFLAIVPCIWLGVRGAATLAELLRARLGVADARVRVGALLVLLAGATTTTFLPWRIAARYVDYRGFHADYLRLAERGGLGRSLVLVRTTRTSDATSATAVNPPTLDPDGPLFARDLGPDVERRLRAAFPDRPVLHVDGRSWTGTATRVAPRER